MTTIEKALAFNLKPQLYGTFSEIGGGQEVANYFFKAGGASGTIAKTISAYDMSVSDNYYGKTKRYVSEERLKEMLNKEYDSLTYYLADQANEKCFFSLANTVETLNFNKSNQGQGWMGVKFQNEANGTPNTCIIHFLLLDTDVALQQEAIGILGVNLLTSLFQCKDNVDSILDSLLDNIDRSRIEINYISFSGDLYDGLDTRLVSLELVKKGLTQVAMFDSNKNILQPINELYKQRLLILRGRFKPPTKVSLDMFEAAMAHLIENENTEKHEVTQIAELTLCNLHIEENSHSTSDFLARADLLCELGFNVLITNFKYHYELTEYLNERIAHKSVHLILGVNNLMQLFDKSLYPQENEILEIMAKIFKNDTKLLVYPAYSECINSTIIDANNVQLVGFRSLYSHLKSAGSIVGIEKVNLDLLDIYADHVLELIQSKNENWQTMVPDKIKQVITEKLLFQVRP